MQTLSSQKSLARFARHLFFVPMLHNRWLTKDIKNKLTNAIFHAEQGHDGEIMLIIENHLPINQAYHHDCHERAVQLFGSQRVWDTQHNTGVLIYLNLCEKTLQIVADRGINAKVSHHVWQALCQEGVSHFKNGQMYIGLELLIHAVGKILKEYYPSADVAGNELADTVVFLK